MNQSAQAAGLAEPATHIRGFVDVLAERAQWPITNEGGEAAGAYGARRRLPLPEGPVKLDSVQLETGEEGRLTPAGDEFVLVLAGDIALRQAGAELKLRAGGAGVVLRDEALDWRSEQGADLIVMSCEAGGGVGAKAPVGIDLAGQLSPSNPPLPEVLLTPTPQCRSRRDYVSASGEFICGVWDSTAYRRRAFTYGHYELMHLLDGEVTLVDVDGREGRFQTGGVALLRQGGASTWEHRGYVRKIYATYKPTA